MDDDDTNAFKSSISSVDESTEDGNQSSPVVGSQPTSFARKGSLLFGSEFDDSPTLNGSSEHESDNAMNALALGGSQFVYSPSSKRAQRFAVSTTSKPKKKSHTTQISNDIIQLQPHSPSRSRSRSRSRSKSPSKSRSRSRSHVSASPLPLLHKNKNKNQNKKKKKKRKSMASSSSDNESVVNSDNDGDASSPKAKKHKPNPKKKKSVSNAKSKSSKSSKKKSSKLHDRSTLAPFRRSNSPPLHSPAIQAPQVPSSILPPDDDSMSWEQVSQIPLENMTEEEFRWYYKYKRDQDEQLLLETLDDRHADPNATYGERIDTLLEIKPEDLTTALDVVKVLLRWRQCVIPSYDTPEHYQQLTMEIYGMCHTESDKFTRWRNMCESIHQVQILLRKYQVDDLPDSDDKTADTINMIQSSIDKMLIWLSINHSTSAFDVVQVENLAKRMRKRRITMTQKDRNRWKTGDHEDEGKKTQEFLELFHKMLDYSKEHNCGRVGNSRIQHAIYNKNGKFTKCYEDFGETGEFAEFVEEAVYNDDIFWNQLNSRPGFAAQLVDRLQKTKDDRLPQLTRVREWHGFEDGLFDAQKIRFYPYESIGFRRLPKNKIACMFHDCYFNDEASEYVVRMLGNLSKYEVYSPTVKYGLNTFINMKYTRWNANETRYKVKDYVDYNGHMYMVLKEGKAPDNLEPGDSKSEDWKQWWQRIDGGFSYISIQPNNVGHFPLDSDKWWKPVPHKEFLKIKEPIQEICKLQEWKEDEQIHIYAEGGALFHAKRKSSFRKKQNTELLHPFQQHLPVQLGPGGCGKTTLLKIFSLFFNANDIAQFKTKDEDVFGMERLPESFIWMGYDIGRNWKIDPHFLFTLIDGGWVKLNRKFKTSILYFVEQFGMIAMNEYLSMPDPGGALSRRLLLHVWQFLPRVGNSNLVQESESYVGWIMKKCCLALRYLTQYVYRGQLAKDDHPGFPQSMRHNIREMRQNTNSILAFFESDNVVIDNADTKGYYIDKSTLNQRYSQWCIRNGFKATKKLDKTTMQDVLSQLRLNILYQPRPDFVPTVKARYKEMMDNAKKLGGNNGSSSAGNGSSSVGNGTAINTATSNSSGNAIHKPVAGSQPPKTRVFEYRETSWVVGATLNGFYQEECKLAMAQFNDDLRKAKEKEAQDRLASAMVGVTGPAAAAAVVGSAPNTVAVVVGNAPNTAPVPAVVVGNAPNTTTASSAPVVICSASSTVPIPASIPTGAPTVPATLSTVATSAIALPKSVPVSVSVSTATTSSLPPASCIISTTTPVSTIPTTNATSPVFFEMDTEDIAQIPGSQMNVARS